MCIVQRSNNRNAGYSALGADPAQVLAIDFGWTCTVPKCDMYEGAKVLDLGFEYNIACLCRLTDVRPSENTEVKLLTGKSLSKSSIRGPPDPNFVLQLFILN